MEPGHFSHASCLGRYHKDKDRYKRYSEALKLVDADMNRTLDITRLFRQLRIQGLGLRLVLNSTQRKELALKAKTKTVEETKRQVVRDEWDTI